MDDMVCSDYFVVDNMVHMGTVQSTVCVDVCVVYSNNKQVERNV